jgi:hypothetical protein
MKRHAGKGGKQGTQTSNSLNRLGKLPDHLARIADLEGRAAASVEAGLLGEDRASKPSRTLLS